jgi:hypothetical protein
MDAEDPAVAQQIVAEYAALLEKHDRDNVYPAPVDTLPYPKETIKTAVRTSVAALASTGQMTAELRDFLEVAYVSLADYVDAELARLLADYREAGAALADAPRLAKEKVTSPAWRVLAESGSLAGTIARTIAEEAETLRQEFRRLAGC